jgi:hypothetical protein
LDVRYVVIPSSTFLGQADSANAISTCIHVFDTPHYTSWE